MTDERKRVVERVQTGVRMEKRILKVLKAFAAYRGDWQAQIDFFLAHGFHKAREMVSFMVHLADTPTPAARRSSGRLSTEY